MSVSAPTTSRIDWLLFVLLGFLWGSSYLFIKIGVEAGLAPLTLVMFRLAIGATLLTGVVIYSRASLPRGSRAYAHLFVLGFFGIALPFSLITWAEGSVDSSLAAVLTAWSPLLVIPLAAAVVPDERLTARNVTGVVVGLVGVAVVVGFDPATINHGSLGAELALIGAASSYAIASVYARRFVRGYPPMIPALFEVATALLVVGVMAFIVEQPLVTPASADAVLAITWLGLFGSGFAFLIFFRLIDRWGAGRTSMVSYLLPLWGIALGALVLGESISSGLVLGTALVIGGIALVNIRRAALASSADGLRDRLPARFGGRPMAETVAPDSSASPR